MRKVSLFPVVLGLQNPLRTVSTNHQDGPKDLLKWQTHWKQGECLAINTRAGRVMKQNPSDPNLAETLPGFHHAVTNVVRMPSRSPIRAEEVEMAWL